MTTIDNREEANLLRAKLSEAQRKLGGCLYLLKRAYDEQLSPRSEMAQLLEQQIRELDCRWEPMPRATRTAWATCGETGTTNRKLAKVRVVK